MAHFRWTKWKIRDQTEWNTLFVFKQKQWQSLWPMNEIHSVNSTSWPLVEKNWTPVWTAAGQFCALVRVRGFVTGLRQPRPQANTTQTIVTVFSPLTPKSPLKDSSTHYGSLSSHSILWEKESKVLLFLCKLLMRQAYGQRNISF